jgi:hypothetical protein
LAGYIDRIMAIALVQGAAEHYAHQRRLVAEDDCGVNDFDVLVIFRQFEDPRLAGQRIYRNRLEADFGQSEFGRHSVRDKFKAGRSVDILMRAIEPVGGTGREILRAYVAAGGESPTYWRRRPIVLLAPHDEFGHVILPIAASR